MIRVKIFKNAVQTHGADFSSLLEAQAWIDENVASNAWGKPERWIKQSDIPVLGENLSESTEFEERTTELGSSLYFKFPAQYTVETSDITAEVTAQEELQESEEAINVGVAIIAKVRTINKLKLRNTIWDAATFNALLINPTMANIERACWNGSLSTAKALVQSLDNTYYTNEEKQIIIDMINAHLTKWV